VTTVRVIKIDFSPSIEEYFKSRDHEQELTVIIHGCIRNRKYVCLELKGTSPRFWVESDEDPREVAGRQAYKITHCVKGESQSLTGEDLWTIHTRHPAEIYSLRKLFEKTFQDNIQYQDAVRAFYGITAFIDVPYDCITGERDFTPDLIKPGANIFRGARDFMFDIETSDTGGFPSKENPTAAVRCLTIQDMHTGVHYVGITKEVDEEKVKDMLSDSSWLKSNCTIEEGREDIVIAPIARDKIVVKCFDISKAKDFTDIEQESERWLFNWFTDLLVKMKPNRIAGHNVWDFDIDYMIKRGNRINNDISKWNKENRGIKLPREEVLNPQVIFAPLVQVFDTMRGYASMISGGQGASGRAALDWMCKQELGYGKINRKGLGEEGKIDYLYVHDPEYLVAYNIWDCEAATRTVDQTDMLEFYSSLTDYNGAGLHTMGSPKKMIISAMTHRLKQKEILPTLKKQHESIKGGYVADAPTLLEEKMFELDLSKEYPSVMITLNLCFKTHVRDLRKITSIETGIDEAIKSLREWEELLPGIEFVSDVPIAIAPSGNCYRQDIKGVVPQILREMATERDEIRVKMANTNKGTQKYRILDNQQSARKVSMNTWYGVIAQVYPAMGGDITECAREHIKWIRDKTNVSTMLFNPKTKKVAVGFTDVKRRKNFMKFGFEVVYSDTDSAKCKISGRKKEEKDFDYLLDEQDILLIGQALAEKLNKSFGEFTSVITGGYTEEHSFSLKVEEAYKAYLQAGAKKRYAYLTFDDQVHTRGFDTRRSDSTLLTKRALGVMFDMMLKNPETGVGLFLDWLVGFEAEIKDGQYDEHCAKPIGLNSPSEKTQHMKAAMASNRLLGKSFKVGDKVYLWWVSGSSKFDTEGIKIFALEYGESPHDHGLEVNYDEIIKKFVRRKVDLTLGPIAGRNIDDLMSGVEAEAPESEIEDLF